MSIAVILLAWAFSLAPAPPSQPLQEGQSPIWASSFEDAKAKADLQGRLVMLVFLGERCPRCPALENHVLTNPRVVEWMERHVIALKLHDDVELAAQYSVGSVPAVLLLDPGRKEIDRITEYLEPPEMVIALLDIYEGRGGLSRARRELEANPEDPDAHLFLARVLVNRGRSADALEHFLWAFDNLRGDPEREDERLRTVLGELKVVQRGVPAATHAISQRRDTAAAILLDAGEPAPPLSERLLCARELVLFNTAINKLNDTYEIWDTLRLREGYPPEVVEALFGQPIQGRLIQEKRFQEYLDGIGDPLVRLEASLAELQVLRMEMEASGKSKLEIANAGNGISFAATWYYEALQGVGRQADADAVVELLLALEPTAQAYISMVGAVDRCGDRERALALVERGRNLLPEDQHKVRFETVTGRLLKNNKR